MKSIILTATDKEISKAYNKSKNYTQLARLLGYNRNINQVNRNKIRKRCEELNLPPLRNCIKDLNKVTKGTLFSSRKNWQSARSAIAKLARKTMLKEKLKKKCFKCGYSNHVEVCHIKNVSSFSNDTLISEINSLDNLVYLCPNHHWELDNFRLTIKKEVVGSSPALATTRCSAVRSAHLPWTQGAVSSNLTI